MHRASDTFFHNVIHTSMCVLSFSSFVEMWSKWFARLIFFACAFSPTSHPSRVLFFSYPCHLVGSIYIYILLCAFSSPSSPLFGPLSLPTNKSLKKWKRGFPPLSLPLVLFFLHETISHINCAYYLYWKYQLSSYVSVCACVCIRWPRFTQCVHFPPCRRIYASV